MATRAKKKTKAAKKTNTQFYSPTGHIAPSDGWQAVWFDYTDDDQGVDMESVDRWPVACWVTCKVGKETQVCGTVSGPYGLELAELDDDFRGYIFVEGDHVEPLKDFVEMWEEEHEVGEFFGNDDEEEEEEEARDED